MTDQQRLELLRAAKKELKLTTQGYVQWAEEGKEGGHWAKAMLALNKLEADLRPDPVPVLGPVVIGGPKLLNQRLTHATSGIPHYPALDAGWVVGLDSLAVEDMTVTRASSANVGDACFTKGVSGIDYWYGHLVQCPAVGTRLRMGAKVGDIAVHPNGAHVHFGMDARVLTGGKDLKYGYGPDVPTVGAQLEAFLA